MVENLENKVPDKKIEKKSTQISVKRILKLAAVALIIIWGLLIWAGNNTEVLEKKFFDWQARRYDQAIQKYVNETKARYAADMDGGKTPEETIELFIKALEDGDIEQASKYYILEKQKQEYAHLKNNILEKNGDLQKSIDFFTKIREKGIKKCNKKMDGCTFEYVYTEMATTTYDVVGMNQKIIVPAGEKTTEAIDVGLNYLSGVWKIQQP